MATITFNAFTFLRPKLARSGHAFRNVEMDVPDGTTVAWLVAQLGLDPEDVEAAFVNGRIGPVDTVLGAGDRVGLVPPGTPGPHRALLGLTRLKRE